MRSVQGRVVREICMLRAMWRELETGLRTTLTGHEGGNPGYRQEFDLTGYRASSRPYRDTPVFTNGQWKYFYRAVERPEYAQHSIFEA